MFHSAFDSVFNFFQAKSKQCENTLKVEDLSHLLGADKVIAVRSVCQAIQVNSPEAADFGGSCLWSIYTFRLVVRHDTQIWDQS
jgi:hypothetical protein